MKKVRMFLLLIAMIAAVTLTACGGGGGGGSSDGGSNSSGDGNGGGATTVTDIDGNVYNTVTIGTQVWMKENLKTTKYRNGDAIPTTTVSISGETSPKYQWAYNGDENNVATYGRLYTWYAATDSRGLCPTGWHLPTGAEWTMLTDYLGGEVVAGGKMKEAGTAHWLSPNTGADNSSGFTALPGGLRVGNGIFSFIGDNGYWWSATEYDAANAWDRIMYNNSAAAARYDSYKNYGFSVRCVKDPTITDIDGNVYNTVTIGTQVWMKENLKVTRYRNGDAIGTTTPATLDISGETSPKYQWTYNGDVNNAAVYGRLYTWYAATDSRGVCPTGWHVPTDAEWTTLTEYLGGAYYGAGGKMKETGTVHWTSPNTGADNSSGWTALPGGTRLNNGSFYSIGGYGYWWSATEYIGIYAWTRLLSYSDTNAYPNYYVSGSGFSVRCVKDPTITDIDGNVYNTVTIGTQVWMKENLKVTRYRNRNTIPTTTADISGETSPKYQWAYNGDVNNAAVYGRLYTWYAATDSRGLCPTGWHLPTDAEWTMLTDYLGGETVAGGKMKEAGTAHWLSPNTGADNSSGWTALPGGFRNVNGTFNYIGYDGYWWSATEYDAASAWIRNLYYNNAYATRYSNYNLRGFSVRCVKDSGAIVIDIDGNIYNTVAIGTQVWMKENLKTTKYRNGDAIGTTTPATLDILGETSPKYQWAYNGDVNNAAVYGRLYTWYAATDSRGLCPTGWHLPTDAEWTLLTDYLGGEVVAGGKMKEAGFAHWVSPNTGADNSSGFTALPGGVRLTGSFGLTIGYNGYWWSATEYYEAYAWSRYMGYGNADAYHYFHFENIGLSVRCVRD